MVLGADEAAFFRDFDPFGFILFARNVESPDQVRRLTASLREAVGRDAPILVDQEGGRVQRLRAPHWREWTPPLDFVTAAGPRAEEALRLRYAILGAELLDVGIDADCAPVGDLITGKTHPFLKNRCYGSDPATVARLGRAVADGLLMAGVMPVMKHLPGHGRSEVDTHHELPTVTASREEVNAHDFAPFRAWRDLPMAMTAHLVFTAWDGERPATQSPAMIRAIREEIGFQGLLMTDDLNMQALKGDLGQRTRASIDAGVDIALHCKGVLAEMQAVAHEAGEMTAQARARAEKVIANRPKASVDIRQAERDLRAIMPDAFHGPN
ncbi:glycoside hydrolase family 3 protein [Stagnihabitans tardus]|uniref:beta-N-acetylhexosaminidase n=1 Tax=Stagnihabitans tardus TaxID=2699202 RepID=A0AAE4Y851_9RHOB|nr:glycoside hydrolase family 3 protein [Stagnihabitans tardus]NBZ87613.1 beta-hexosaminidase [Stagnihabitans tardus]